MKDKLKGLLLGLVIGSAAAGGTVLAANPATIEVVYDNLRYMVDGVEHKPETGEGFLYKGTTYVPLRFAGEALGKEVSWDGKTKTVWIGPREGEAKYLTDLEYARMDHAMGQSIHFDVWSGDKKFRVAGKEYLHGLGVSIGYAWSDTVSIEYNLNGSYKSFSALLGVDDSTRNSKSAAEFKVLGDGKELYASPGIRGGDPASDMKVNVSGVKKLKIVFENDKKDQVEDLKFVLAEAKLTP